MRSFLLCAEPGTAQQPYLNLSAVHHEHQVLPVIDITSNGTPVALKQSLSAAVTYI